MLEISMNNAGTLETQDAADPALPRAAEIAQLIVRARRRLREEGVQFEVPEGVELPAHLDAVLEALYALFFEGYRPAGDAVPRAELCES